jgi:hypothetical protein
MSKISDVNILKLKFSFSRVSRDFNFSTQYYGHSFHPEKYLNEAYPLKSSSEKQGFMAGLNRSPNNDWEIDAFGAEVHQGFLIVFHDPFELPTKSLPHYYTQTGQTLTFFVEPELISTDDSVLGGTPEEFETF